MKKLALVLVILVSSLAHAGETDDYYLWLRPVRDATPRVNALVRDEFAATLKSLNRDARARTCPDVARALAYPFTLVEYRFTLRARREFGVEMAPASNVEMLEREGPRSLYRYVPVTTTMGMRVPLLRLVGLNAVFPRMQVAGVNFGVDKLAHFFPTGLRYYDLFHRRLDEGASAEDALEAALMLGVETERGIWGQMWGVFSYADLESNYQGLRFLQDLCDGPDPMLKNEGGQWHFVRDFDFRNYVTPCWDESFYASAFTDDVAPHIHAAMRETYCKARGHPRVVERRARYAREACDNPSFRLLEVLAERGEIPDRRRHELDAVCNAADFDKAPR